MRRNNEKFEVLTTAEMRWSTAVEAAKQAGDSAEAADLWERAADLWVEVEAEREARRE